MNLAKQQTDYGLSHTSNESACTKNTGTFFDDISIEKEGIKTMSCNKDNAFILFHVIRERRSEQQVWVTHVALLVDEDVQKRMDITQNPEKTAEELLRERIRAWLTTQKGWDENCRCCLDFNWGDAAMALPLREVGLYNSPDDLPGAYHVIGNYDMLVDQDELLAPDDVPCVLELTDQSGTMFTVSGSADFQTGSAIITNNEQYDIKNIITVTLVLKNGNRFACSTDKDNEVFSLISKWK